MLRASIRFSAASPRLSSMVDPAVKTRCFSSFGPVSDKNDNSKTPEDKQTHTTGKKAPLAKLLLNTDQKFSKFIREFNRNASSLSSDPAPSPAKKSTYYSTAGVQLPQNLPRVPNTSHLDMRKFRQDILYSGYRPLLLPIKDDANLTFRFDKSGYMKKSDLQAAPRPAPNNIWNNSALGTQRFSEMDNVPYSVVLTLMPFARPPPPGMQNSNPKPKSPEAVAKQKQKDRITNWKAFFSNKGFKN